jgi:uncharacterized protein (DUF1015 family)
VGSQQASGRPGGLVVTPFRGLRYAADRVSDLAAVTSPPYDVIDPDDATHLEQLDPHNVVRLILPRDTAGPGTDGSSRYAHAAELLARWQADGVLVRDEQPALYVYEQSGPALLQRGIIAAVDLRDPADRVVLPHEDVMPGPVTDRLELMRATEANLEPILLVYDGAEKTAAVVDEVATRRPPLVETVTVDGLTKRLWPVTDPEVHELVRRDLEPRQALIADGHHRWATYRRLQAERRAAGAAAGPWDRGLALLVDSRAYPLRVAAIHRVVDGLGLPAALEAAGRAFRVTPAGADLPAALHHLGRSRGPHAFVVTDGTGFHLLDEPDARAVAAAVPPDRPPRWRELDATVLHALLLERLWSLPETSGRVEYLHEAGAAVRAARRSSGVAVLMRPVDVGDVLALAADGERMPRKSTSFGPKPRTGLVLRPLDDEMLRARQVADARGV